MIVVAEVGSNWKSPDDCLLSIQRAKECKASAVKFQLFTPDALFGPFETKTTMAGHSPYLDPRWLPMLADKCKKQEIEFMCTAFSHRDYEMVNEYVQIHKIASAELSDITILEKVNMFGKPVYLSTAGSDYEEINNALGYLRDCPVTIFYCVGDYPAKVVDFHHLDKLKEFFGNGYQYGYSDHSTDVLNIPKLASDHGVSVIEKHVNFTSWNTTQDAGHSISGEELSIMVEHLNSTLNHNKTADMTNQNMRNLWKRKLVVTSNIRCGDRFVLGQNVGIYRPMKKVNSAISPFALCEVEKSVACRDMIVGQVLTYNDIDGL